MSGPDRIRAAIVLDRTGGPVADQIHGLNSVSCCGQPDPSAMRADDPRWPGNRAPSPTWRQRFGEAVSNAILCPACLRLRVSPGHWITCR